MSALTDLAKTLARILASALNGGSMQPDGGSDPAAMLKGMEQDADEVVESYGEDQQFEKSIAMAVKTGLSLAAGMPGATMAEKMSGAIPEMTKQFPQILERAGLDNLISDYTNKNSSVLEAKINNVVSDFSSKNLMLGGVAAGFANEFGKYIAGSVPKSPLQKSGLVPDPNEISQSLDNQPKPAQEVRHESSPSLSR